MALPYPDGAQCTATNSCLGESRDFSTGGELIVGNARIPDRGSSATASIDTAFTYTQAQGSLGLNDLAGGAQASGAYTVSANGRIIGGFGTDADGPQAVVWVQRIPRLLADLLRDAGGSLPAGFRLREVRAVSSDGRIFAGNGTNVSGAPEAFRIVLPRAP